MINTLLSSLPVVVLFILTLSFNIGGEAYNTRYVRKSVKIKSDVYIMSTFKLLSCGLILFALNGFQLKASSFTILLGIAFGLIVSLNTIFTALAVKTGPWSYTMIILNASTIITSLSGILFFNDPPLKFTKYIGIGLMFISLILSISSNKEDEKKSNVIWFIFALIAMLTCAGIGLLQKVHQSSDYKNELMVFLIFSFLISSVISFIIYLIVRNKENKEGIKPEKIKISYFILSMLFLGLYTAAIHTINLYLSGVVNSAVFFPIVNGVPLMGSLIISFLVFKEKLEKKQIIGLIVGLISIAFLILF